MPAAPVRAVTGSTDEGTDDEKVSTPVGEQPTWDGADSRGVPGRTRRAREGDGRAAEPVTVEQLLARQGGSV